MSFGNVGIEVVKNENARRFVLKRITGRMVEELSLNVSRDDVYEDLGPDKPVKEVALDNLLSDEILAKGIFNPTTDCFFSQHSL